jgi:hypothetical protein
MLLHQAQRAIAPFAPNEETPALRPGLFNHQKSHDLVELVINGRTASAAE